MAETRTTNRNEQMLGLTTQQTVLSPSCASNEARRLNTSVSSPVPAATAAKWAGLALPVETHMPTKTMKRPTSSHA